MCAHIPVRFRVLGVAALSALVVGLVAAPASAQLDETTVESDNRYGGNHEINFTLREKSEVVFDYATEATRNNGNFFRIRIYTRSPSGGWRDLDNIVHVFKPKSGVKKGKLPAAEYKVTILAKRMTYRVTLSSHAVED